MLQWREQGNEALCDLLLTTMTHWKTTLTGSLTGLVLLINGGLLPFLEQRWGDWDWSQVLAGLGALGLGWFAGDKKAVTPPSPSAIEAKKASSPQQLQEEAEESYRSWMDS